MTSNVPLSISEKLSFFSLWTMIVAFVFRERNLSPRTLDMNYFCVYERKVVMENVRKLLGVHGRPRSDVLVVATDYNFERIPLMSEASFERRWTRDRTFPRDPYHQRGYVNEILKGMMLSSVAGKATSGSCKLEQIVHAHCKKFLKKHCNANGPINW